MPIVTEESKIVQYLHAVGSCIALSIGQGRGGEQFSLAWWEMEGKRNVIVAE